MHVVHGWCYRSLSDICRPMCVGYKQCKQDTSDVGRPVCAGNKQCKHDTSVVSRPMCVGYGDVCRLRKTSVDWCLQALNDASRNSLTLVKQCVIVVEHGGIPHLTSDDHYVQAKGNAHREHTMLVVSLCRPRAIWAVKAQKWLSDVHKSRVMEALHKKCRHRDMNKPWPICLVQDQCRLANVAC